MNKYPLVKLLMRYGTVFAATVALGTALVVSLAGAGAPLWIGGGVLAGIVVFILLKSYVELVEILSDMLMPR